MTSSNSWNSELNSPPTNESCSIQPSIDTTSILFNDSFESSQRTLISFSPDLSSRWFLSFSIVDDCLTEWKNLSSLVVRSDPKVFEDFFSMLDGESTSNALIQLLNNGNLNQVGQVITFLTEHINLLDEDNLQQVISHGISASSFDSPIRKGNANSSISNESSHGKTSSLSLSFSNRSF